MTEKTCPICGTIFPVPKTRPNQIYCSPACSIIGRRRDLDRSAFKRVTKFFDELADNIKVVDVLSARLSRPGGTDNSITAKGARSWQGEGRRFILLVVEDDKKEDEPNRKEFYTVDDVINGKRP